MEPASPRPPASGGPDESTSLTAVERAVYEWQMWVPGFGEAGQARLKASSVLVTRVGGLGGAVAYELAAAGIGRLVLAHRGDVKPSDLNRQILMTHEAIGTPRVECARHRLLELNPRLHVETVPENASSENAAQLVSRVDLVVDAAPLFRERFALNAACVAQRKPLVECAMYELQAQVTTIEPGRTACLACLIGETPPSWQREFPVFGAVSGAVGCLGAMEAIKVLSGLGEPLHDRWLTMDLRTMAVTTLRLARDPGCSVCSSLG